MGLKEDKTITDIVQAVKESDAKKTKGYDTTATVTRIEDGKAWVHIPGGVTETPAELTINAKPGDNVMVRVAGGRAFLLGNATNPPTDDATAKEALSNAADALQSAVNAKRAADSAEASAATASAAAQDAVETAESVHDIAVQAQEDAETAKTNAQTAITNAAAAQTAASNAQTSADNAQASAQSAQNSADSALVGLSTVQDVVGVLNWITAHGTMTSQSGETFDESQVYFVLDDTTPGDYHVGNHYYSIVAEPKAADINNYYVLAVDESVQNYVATHIVADSEGLWIIPDADGSKILIATGQGSTYTTAGTYIVDKVNNVDKVLAKFLKSEVIIGEEDSGHMMLTNSLLSMAFLRNNAPVETFRVENGRLTIKDAFHTIHPASDAALGFAFNPSTDAYKFVFSGPDFAFTESVYMRTSLQVDEQTTLNGGSESNVYFPGTMGGNHEECPLAVEGGYETYFAVVLDPVSASSDTLTSEVIMALEGYQTSGNVDKTIYDALNSLGWLSDCTES